MKSQRIRRLLALLVAGLGGAWIVSQDGTAAATSGDGSLSTDTMNHAATEAERTKALAKLIADWRRQNPTAPTPGNREFVTLLGQSGESVLRGVIDGQFVDGWNTAYWIASSGEVRSAGIDRIFYTLDDLVEGRNRSADS